jgi:glutamate carboxypeptidase
VNPSESVVRWLADKTVAMEASLRRLVDINSYTENVEGGRQVGAVLRDEVFAMEGLGCRVQPSQAFADHLIFSSDGAAGKAPVALVGHLDTVFPPGTFEGVRTDGDLTRGPGVLDMKGGLVVIAYALRAVAEVVGLGAAMPVRVVIVSDEEVGSPEGKAVIQGAVAGAASALVFEAGRKADAIIVSRKGVGALTAEAEGKAAHAGANHRDGANAIWALSRFIDRAQQLTDYEAGITVNCGKVSGGLGRNTVPHEASAHFDFRFVTRADGERLMARFQEAAEEAAVPGTRIRLSGGIGRLPLERSAENVALMQAYAACARASGLGDAEAPLIGGGSDASTTSQMGIASIDGLGPRGQGFHTKDEQIETATLVPKAQALARFLIHA